MRRDELDRGVSDHELVRALKALADRTRFRIVQEIAESGELSCAEVTARFEVSQPTISHHLKILVDAGLLVQRTEGKQHFTSVDHAWLNRLAALLPKRLNAASKAARG